MIWRNFLCSGLVLLAASVLGGCGDGEVQVPAATPTATLAVTTIPTATPSVSASPTRSNSATPAHTATRTASATGTAAQPSATPSVTETLQPSATMTGTASPSPSPSTTGVTPSVTPTASPSATTVSTVAVTATPSSTPTASLAPTSSQTPTVSATRTASTTATASPTSTATPDVAVGDDCGNGVTEPWEEECDDGNDAGGDGCGADCRLEPGGDPCIGIAQRSGDQLQLERVASGLTRPVALRAAPGDVNRLFVVEQRGRIRIIKRGVVLPTPFLDLSHKVTFGTELGLLSIAFHPDYARNGVFYVYYLETPSVEIGLRSVVSRFQVSADPDVAEPTSERILMLQPQPWNVHKGGDLFFGTDGYLYVPFGDGGLSTSRQDNGQSLDTWLGKILRIDVDGGDPYRVPPDNPFVATPNALPEIWAMGFRNPWRVSLDRLTRHMFIGDVGEGRYEEVDVVPAGVPFGLNFGWPRVEGNVCLRTPCNPQQFVSPLVEYLHADGHCSVIGGYVYRGCSMPSLHDHYFHSDFCSGFVRSFVYSNGTATDRRDWTAMLQPSERVLTAVSSFGQDARGELYICDLDGEVYRLVSGDG